MGVRMEWVSQIHLSIFLGVVRVGTVPLEIAHKIKILGGMGCQKMENVEKSAQKIEILGGAGCQKVVKRR